MKISSYNLKKRLQINQRRHKAFNFQYFTSNEQDFLEKVERWSSRNKDLQIVLESLQGGNYKWHEIPVFNNERDLAGVELKNVDAKDFFGGLEYINFNYSSFDSCRFVAPDTENVAIYQSLFMACKMNHTHFKSCEFKNVFFSDGEYQNIVFYNCSFENVEFDKNRDGKYKNIFFQNCTFINVNFKNVDCQSFCFWGECNFKDLIYSEKSFHTKKIIANDIINICKEWDDDSYNERIENHYIGGPYNKIEIEFYQEDKIKLQIPKYASVINCYSGLIDLYSFLYTNEDQKGEHAAYLAYNYIYHDVKDKKKNLLIGKLKNAKYFISKFIFGYGTRSENPLITYLIMIIIFSIFYLFSGVIYIEKFIQRPFSFNLNAYSETLHDLSMCLYLSVVTSTTIGYGDVRPGTGTTMMLASIQGILGILLMTMFTVIFGRRFFK